MKTHDRIEPGTPVLNPDGDLCIVLHAHGRNLAGGDDSRRANKDWMVAIIPGDLETLLRSKTPLTHRYYAEKNLTLLRPDRLKGWDLSDICQGCGSPVIGLHTPVCEKVAPYIDPRKEEVLKATSRAASFTPDPAGYHCGGYAGSAPTTVGANVRFEWDEHGHFTIQHDINATDRRGDPWDEQEECRLVKLFEDALLAVATHLGRSPGAVRSKLERLGASLAPLFRSGDAPGRGYADSPKNDAARAARDDKAQGLAADPERHNASLGSAWAEWYRQAYESDGPFVPFASGNWPDENPESAFYRHHCRLKIEPSEDNRAAIAALRETLGRFGQPMPGIFAPEAELSESEMRDQERRISDLAGGWAGAISQLTLRDTETDTFAAGIQRAVDYLVQASGHPDRLSNTQLQDAIDKILPLLRPTALGPNPSPETLDVLRKRLGPLLDEQVRRAKGEE